MREGEDGTARQACCSATGTSSSDALVYQLFQLLMPQLSRSIWQEKGHLHVHRHIGRGACLSYVYGLKDRWGCR